MLSWQSSWSEFASSTSNTEDHATKRSLVDITRLQRRCVHTLILLAMIITQPEKVKVIPVCTKRLFIFEREKKERERERVRERERERE